MITNQVCRVCGVELDDENWYPSFQKSNTHTCKECHTNRGRVWFEANPEKARLYQVRATRKKGCKPFNENKECALYLGCHIAERVLSHVFKDVEVMPPGNPGYDLICNRGKRVDVKCGCLHGGKRTGGRWLFRIAYNTTADYFLCLAFDNRETLNPLHAWLLPGSKFSHLSGTTIRPSTIDKWDEYRLDLTKISDCCDEMR